MESLSEKNVSGQVLDHLGLVAATIENLGLTKKIDERLPVSANKGSKVSMGQRVAAMILNGLGFVDDRLYMFPEFLSNKPVERLCGKGLTAKDFNDDALGRCLDAIYRYGTTKLFTEIAFEIGLEQKLLGHSAHFDTSSISVYGEYKKKTQATSTGEESSKEAKQPIQITHGYAKNKRFDLKQMVINLSTTGAAAFPIWMEAHSGNASDKKILVQAAERMKEFCKHFNESPDFLYVGDSAMYEKCVKQKVQMKWLSRVPQSIGEAKSLVQQPDEAFVWQDCGNGYKVTPVSSTYGNVQQRWLLVSSEQAFIRESKTLDKQIDKEAQALKKTLWHLSHESFKCKRDAKKEAKTRLKKLKLKYHQVSFKLTKIKKHRGLGRPKKDSQEIDIYYCIQGTLKANEEKIALKRREKGRFILATNELDQSRLSDIEMLPEYKGQSKTESGFRFIKSHAFEVSSIFLKKPERIEALMMVMVLCLMIYSFAQYHLRQSLQQFNETVPNQVKKPTNKPSMAWIFRMFQGIQVLHVHFEAVIQQFVINVSETSKRIIRFFGQRAEAIYGLNSTA